LEGELLRKLQLSVDGFRWGCISQCTITSRLTWLTFWCTRRYCRVLIFLLEVLLLIALKHGQDVVLHYLCCKFGWNVVNGDLLSLGRLPSMFLTWLGVCQWAHPINCRT
jgi:hypothetical protein